MKTLKFSFIALLGVLTLSHDANAWGDRGHRIVGGIADKLLGRTARKQVEKLLGGESLARAATWPDEIRSAPEEYYKQFIPMHFIEIPPGKDLSTAPRNPKGDVLAGIEMTVKTLKDSAATQEKKIEALRLLVHFVGDVHQPLHVGNGLDAGGNACQVKLFGKPTNLHSVWDSGLIDYLDFSYTEYRDILLKEYLGKYNEKAVKEWEASSYEDWITESAVLREKVYPTEIKKDGSGDGRPQGLKNYCTAKKGDVIPNELVPNIGYEYAYIHRREMEKRLAQAGLRLATVLNSIYPGPKFEGAPDLDFPFFP